MVEKIAAKLNMEKRRAEMLITALVVLLLMLCAVPATRAMFEAGTNIDVGVSFGEANTSFEYEITGGNLRNPGDTQTVKLKVHSAGNIPMRYFFTVERNTEASRLAAYLAMYWDGEYIGMLSDLTTGKLGTFDEGATIPTFVPVGADTIDSNRYFLIPGDTQEHELKLEYHIGASAIDAATAKSAEIKVRGYAETIDLKNETVVYTADDFEQAILLSNYGKLTQNRVILGANIAITKNLTLDGVNSTVGALHIDINGHTLGLNSGSLTVKDGVSGSGILILHDSCGGGVISGGSGSIVLQGSGAYIAGEGLADYIGTFNVSAYSPSSDALNAIYGYAREQAEKAVKGGVQSGETNSFLKGYGAYGNALSISAPSYVGYSASAGTVTPTAERNMNAIVNIGGRAIIFEIIGSLGAGGEDNLDAVVNEIESKYLSYLTGGSTGESVVYYDILLPTRLKGYNCHIEWFSSNPEVLDATGNYTSPWVDQSVTLQAIYTVNDFSTTRTYDITVKGYSYEDKMSFFMAHMGVIKFNLLPEDHSLWSKDDYADVGNCGKDLNIKSISYSIPGQNPGDVDNYTGFLQFAGDDGMALRLYSISNIFEAYINVRIEFEAPPALAGAPATGANVMERQITVIIDLDDYTTAEDILKYVQKSIMEQTVYPKADRDWTIPVDLYDRMSLQGYGYPTTLRLPAYYEAIAYAYDENGNPFEYTAGFHPIEYLIVNSAAGDAPGDSDGGYDIAKTGTLEIEYTNTDNAYSAARLTNPGTTMIAGKSTTYEGIEYYTLNVDISKLKSDDQDLNIIVSLDTPFAGKENSIGEWVDSTPQDRRNLSFRLPGVLRADMFDGDNGNGDAIYNEVFTDYVSAGLPNAHTSYVFTRDVTAVRSLDFDKSGKCGLADANLWTLKYFTNLENLDISGSAGSKYDVTDDTITILSKLTKLKHLDMSNCKLKNIDKLEGLTDMEYLDVSGNASLDHVTVVANMAGNLGVLNAANTACNNNLNEWAYAFAYFKYRDAKNGTKPSITRADGTLYEPPYALWEKPDAYKMYRKLVYTNGEYTEIGEAEKQAGYVWLPKVMLESRTSGSFTANDYFGTGWSDSWTRQTGGNYANITVSNSTDATYGGWQINLANAQVGRTAIAGHLISTPVSTGVYDSGTGEITPAAENVTVSSTRYFFFKIIQ